MPCSRTLSSCSLTPRLYKIPPWILGCRVLTRPSSISGKPVYSPTSVTGILFSLSVRAVPPLEIISNPSSCSPLAKWTTPILSKTEIKAVGIFSFTNSFFDYLTFFRRYSVKLENQVVNLGLKRFGVHICIFLLELEDFLHFCGYLLC